MPFGTCSPAPNAFSLRSSRPGNFEFGETQNDWVKLVPKLNLVFMILEVSSVVFALLSQKRKSIIDGASFENILDIIIIRKVNLIFFKSSIQSSLHSKNSSFNYSDLIPDWKKKYLSLYQTNDSSTMARAFYYYQLISNKENFACKRRINASRERTFLVIYLYVKLCDLFR
jgi:hypothetical protein